MCLKWPPNGYGQPLRLQISTFFHLLLLLLHYINLLLPSPRRLSLLLHLIHSPPPWERNGGRQTASEESQYFKLRLRLLHPSFPPSAHNNFPVSLWRGGGGLRISYIHILFISSADLPFLSTTSGNFDPNLSYLRGWMDLISKYRRGSETLSGYYFQTAAAHSPTFILLAWQTAGAAPGSNHC